MFQKDIFQKDAGLTNDIGQKGLGIGSGLGLGGYGYGLGTGLGYGWGNGLGYGFGMRRLFSGCSTLLIRRIFPWVC